MKRRLPRHLADFIIVYRREVIFWKDFREGVCPCIIGAAIVPFCTRDADARCAA